ncbi:MAG: DUF4931 domain-containing protein [Planctomycetota bacterium]
MSSEFRFDPLHRRWVIISRQRASRPNDFRAVRYEQCSSDDCPFCEGNEHETPPELFAVRAGSSPPNGPGWTLRVVPNRYPAVSEERLSGFGRHEVVVETNEHGGRLDELDPAQQLTVVRAYRDRVRELSADERVNYVVVFRNSGPKSGASLVHPHTQIMALKQVPPAMETELLALGDHLSECGRCLACDLVESELLASRRVLSGEGEFVSYLPYAGRFPGEMIVTSRGHPVPFGQLEEDQLGRLTPVLMDALSRAQRALGHPSFNWIMHTATDGSVSGGHHWRFELIPRLGQLGGFELSTGMYINSAPPEMVAERFRDPENASWSFCRPDRKGGE